MHYLTEIVFFLSIWGSVIGLLFDIVGAYLVYMGVRISFAEAFRLESPVLPMLMDDLGNEVMALQARKLSHDRVKERLRAKFWSFVGLAFFILGFLLQAIGSWPKK